MGEFSSGIPEYLEELERNGFIEVDGDTIYFCDPVYGTRTQPGEVPPSLYEDEISQKGFATLQRLTQNGISIRIAFNYHRGEEDFSSLQNRATWLEECKVVGLEWGSDPEATQSQNTSAPKFDLLTSTGNGLYVGLTKEWLENKGIPTVPSDINTHITAPDETTTLRLGQGELRARLAQIWAYTLEIGRKTEDSQLVEDWEQYHLAWSVYQYMRQYLLLAHFGYMVSHYEGELQPGDTIGLVIGSGHMVGVPEKARQLGIEVDDELIYTKDTIENEEKFNKAVPSGQIARDGLKRMAVSTFE